MIETKCKSKAVSLDAVGTLFSLRAPVGEIYAECARRFGFEFSSPTLVRDLTESFRQAFRRQGALAFPDAGARLREAEKAWWRSVVYGTFAPFGVPSRIDEIFEDLYDLFRTSAPWRLDEHAVDALTSLRAKEYRIAVVTNYDSRIHDVLKHLGVSELVDAVIVSSAAGAAKPDPRVFLAACSRLEVAPEQTTHVGDDYEEDFQGARSAGLAALLFDPEVRRPELKTMRISRLAELADILL